MASIRTLSPLPDDAQNNTIQTDQTATGTAYTAHSSTDSTIDNTSGISTTNSNDNDKDTTATKTPSQETSAVHPTPPSSPKRTMQASTPYTPQVPPALEPATPLDQILIACRLVSLIFLMLGTVISVLSLGAPALILKYAHSHTAYRSYMRLIQQVFGSSLFILITLFMPSSQLIITGDFDDIQPNTKSVIMANHQIYPDWFYLWCLARLKGLHGDVKILLMQKFYLVPLFGWGMKLFEFIPLAQKWAIDESRITAFLKPAKKPTHPIWLLIFPEGTLNTNDTKEKSLKYAEKVNIPDRPKHVLIPKSTGLFHCLSTLQPEITNLFDLTVGYSGLKPSDEPYYYYLLDRIFLKGFYPHDIHVHIERIPVSTIPGIHTPTPERPVTDADKEEFTLWLRRRFMQKDERITTFFESGLLVKGAHVARRVVPLVADVQDWVVTGVAWYLGLQVMLPVYWSLLVFIIRLLF